MRRLRSLWTAVCFVLLASASMARGSQPVYTLHGFSGSDGSAPVTPLLQTADGSFYGTTSHGGANGSGVIFRITGKGEFTDLYDFSALVTHTGGGIADPGATNGDGTDPSGLVLGGDGNFYGTTAAGGVNGHGTLFRISPFGNLTTLHSFSPYSLKTIAVTGGTTTELVNADGAVPSGLTLGVDGNLYGVTSHGGANGNGIVFRLTPGGAFSTLHDFGEFRFLQALSVAQQTDMVNSDGANPQSALVRAADGAFYGVAAWGGPDGQGSIYRITSAGALSVISTYGGGHLIQTSIIPLRDVPAVERITLTPGADGNLYGTTEGKITRLPIFQPQTDFGTLFRMTPTGLLTKLYTFSPTDKNGNNADGISPLGALQIGAGGHLFGTASSGGENGRGTIFDLAPNGTLTTLYSFSGGDGANPQSLLLARDGNLYGTAAAQGLKGHGVVFEVSPKPIPFVLHDFNGDEGFAPTSLLQGRDGDFYGIAYSSAPRGIGAGTVFRAHVASDTAAITVLHEFGYARPSLLTQGSDGALYGSESQQNHLYRVTTSGNYQLLYDFKGRQATDGSIPFAGILQATDGNFYGVNAYDGPQGSGTLFRLTQGGTLTVEHAFNGFGFEGYFPTTPLMQASDGNLYGMTNRGGVAANSADGAIYKISPSGVFTTLHRFGSRPGESVNPYGTLVDGQDGYLYGATHGIYEPATLFKLPKNADVGRPNDLITLYTFANEIGLAPSGLMRASDGNFYGLVGPGGSAITGASGAIFRLTPGGDFSVIHQFHGLDGAEGFYAPLIEGKDGNLYGIASQGGAFGYNTNLTNGSGFGTFFRLAIGRPGGAAFGGAADVSSQISLAFKGHSVIGGVHTYSYVLTNNGGALAGPLYVALDNLPNGTLLLNANGNTSQTVPSGSPYVLVTSGGLAAGAVSNPTLLKLNRLLTNLVTRRILAGPGAP